MEYQERSDFYIVFTKILLLQKSLVAFYSKLYKSQINYREFAEQFEGDWQIWASYLTKQIS